LTDRADEGELWGNTVSRIIAFKMGADAIQYWRTSTGNELDFVLSDFENYKTPDETKNFFLCHTINSGCGYRSVEAPVWQSAVF